MILYLRELRARRLLRKRILTAASSNKRIMKGVEHNVTLAYKSKDLDMLRVFAKYFSPESGVRDIFILGTVMRQHGVKDLYSSMTQSHVDMTKRVRALTQEDFADENYAINHLLGITGILIQNPQLEKEVFHLVRDRGVCGTGNIKAILKNNQQVGTPLFSGVL